MKIGRSKCSPGEFAAFESLGVVSVRADRTSQFAQAATRWRSLFKSVILFSKITPKRLHQALWLRYALMYAANNSDYILFREK
jgi:hypothetical protein